MEPYLTLPDQQPICTRPFEWFEVHPDGSVFLCCPSWLKRPIGNLLRENVAEIWNGPVAREIRKSILNGSFHNCSRSRCPHLANKTFPVCAPERVSDTAIKSALSNKLSTLPYLPKMLNLCFDHSCNLACPSCRKQKQQAKGDDLRRARKISAVLLNELLPHARTITLSGFGDPFSSPTYLELLRKINQHDFPKLEQIRLHCNGLLLTEQIWQSLPALHRLVSEIEISIDAATEQTYQVNRPGGNFKQLLANLDFLSRIGCQLTLSMVVQQNNWREIPQLLELANGYNAKLYLSQLVNWGTFSREEFEKRAVHLKGHPEHQKAKRLIHSLKGLNGVELGNLNLVFTTI
jgi:MoaA/NifB/PqqE/SkfB family radical SAM enzyme